MPEPPASAPVTRSGLKVNVRVGAWSEWPLVDLSRDGQVFHLRRCERCLDRRPPTDGRVPVVVAEELARAMGLDPSAMLDECERVGTWRGYEGGGSLTWDRWGEFQTTEGERAESRADGAKRKAQQRAARSPEQVARDRASDAARKHAECAEQKRRREAAALASVSVDGQRPYGGAPPRVANVRPPVPASGGTDADGLGTSVAQDGLTPAVQVASVRPSVPRPSNTNPGLGKGTSRATRAESGKPCVMCGAPTRRGYNKCDPCQREADSP